MGGWDAVLAGVGGAAGGVYNAQRFYQQDETKRQLAELRDMLAKVQEGGRNDRNAANLKSREELAAEARAQKDKDRELKGQQVANDLEKFWQSDDTKRTLAGQHDETTRRGQDLTDARGWDASTRGWSLGQQGIDARLRGQDLSAETSRGNAQLAAGTARRGQDISADTSRSNAQTAAGTAGQGRAARTAIDLLKLRRAEAGNVMSDPNNPTDWANEFDALYQDQGAAASEAVQRAQGQPVPVPPRAAAPAGPPAAPPAPPAGAAPTPAVVPPAAAASPRVAPSPTPAAPAGGAPKFTPGMRLKLKNGAIVTVQSVNPDGTPNVID